jgi:hypothetical protein
MEKTEICMHCGVDYVPTRRGVQIFCSNSCRSRYWYLKQNRNNGASLDKKKNEQVTEVVVQEKTEKMSLAGIGNATVGVVAADFIKTVFTKDENKPATKKDIQDLKSMINGGRYLRVNNAKNDALGRKAFFDVETGYVVYL